MAGALLFVLAVLLIGAFGLIYLILAVVQICHKFSWPAQKKFCDAAD